MNVGDAIGGAVGGASAGAGIGAAIAPAVKGAAGGGPIGAVIGAGVGIASSLLGGGSKDKGDGGAKTRRRKTHKLNKKTWKFNKKENQRKYEHQVEGLKIRKENDKEQREYQEQISENNYDHAMAIRDYEFQQANRAYDRSVADANEQVSFNQMASRFAIRQQDRYKEEMLRGFMFDKRQTMLDFALNSAGLFSKKDALDLQAKKIKADATFKTQGERIKGLKARGEAVAKGTGRSAAKNAQAAMAEAGANQAAIAEQLMFGLSDIDINYDVLGTQADAMSKQLILDNVKLRASTLNLEYRDQMARQDIAFKLADANRRAEASIHAKPELSPAMPKPVALPEPEYQDIYKPKDPPKPKRGAGHIYSPTPSYAQSFVPAAMGMVQSFAKAGMFGGNRGYAEQSQTPFQQFNSAPANYLGSSGLASNLNSSSLFSGFTSSFPGTSGGGTGWAGIQGTSGIPFGSSTIA